VDQFVVPKKSERKKENKKEKQKRGKKSVNQHEVENTIIRKC
jgi:hypothetical protein